MYNGSTRLLHTNVLNYGFSCECYPRKCVYEMWFVFIEVSMLFKQELIFFTRFTIFYEGDINENILEWILILSGIVDKEFVCYIFLNGRWRCNH
jgi:hypothetical protein